MARLKLEADNFMRVNGKSMKKLKKEKIMITQRCMGCFHDDINGWKIACYTCKRMPVAERRIRDKFVAREKAWMKLKG